MGRNAGGGKSDGFGIKLLGLVVIFGEDGLIPLPLQRLGPGLVGGGGRGGGRGSVGSSG